MQHLNPKHSLSQQLCYIVFRSCYKVQWNGINKSGSHLPAAVKGYI